MNGSERNENSVRGQERELATRRRVPPPVAILSFLLSSTALSSPAMANCIATGTTTVTNCDASYVGVTMSPGAGTLTVNNLTSQYVAYASPTTSGTYNQIVDLTGTTNLNNPTYSALVMQFGTDGGGQRIPVTVNATVNIGASSQLTMGGGGGFGAVWVRNDNAGDVVVDNAGTLFGTAQTTSATGPATLDAVTNNGSVTVTNSGSVTSTNSRGIYADGNHDGTAPVTVSVTNTATGTVSAYTAAIRVINYNGLAQIENQGTVTSTLFQGLIAWSANGDATITNSGSVTSGNDNAIYAATEIGKATVTNSGTVTALGDPTLDVDRATLRSAQGYNGLRASASSSGDIEIVNTATGVVSAGRDAGIRAETPQGNVNVTNAGTVTGSVGIAVDSGFASGVTGATVSTVLGNIAVTNTGTVTATSYGVALDGTTNGLTNSGTISTTGSVAVLMGNGATTIVNSGTIASTTPGGTAIRLGTGADTLTLASTSVINGDIVKTGGTLALTGGGAMTGTLDLQGGATTFTGSLVPAGHAASTVDLRASGGTLLVNGLQSTAQLTTRRTTIGATSGTSSVIVSGAGASWTNDADGVALATAAGQTGAITVNQGGLFAVRGTGLYTGAGGSLSIDGVGTRVEIGNPAQPNVQSWLSMDGGTVSVSGGANLYTSGTYVGAAGNAPSTLTLTGAGTTFAGEVRLYVGGQNGTRDVDPVNGNGSMTISAGATAWAGTVGVGMDPRSQGTVVVTGSGSQLWAKANTALTTPTAGNFYVGYNGAAVVAVSNGATIMADNEVRIGYAAQGSGQLAIGGQAGAAAAAPGTVTATNGIVFGSGSGALVFNHTSSNYEFGASISGAGTIDAYAGTTILTGNSPDFTGTTQVFGGELKVAGYMPSVSVTVQAGAELSGTGTVGSVVALSGSLVTPGNSPGTLTVTGNYQQASGSVYLAEVVPGSTVSDLVLVGGTATIQNGAVLAVSQYGGGNVGLNSRYTVLTAAGGVNGTYTLSGDTAVSAFYSLVAEYDANNVYLAATQTRSLAAAAITPNQASTANSLQSLGIGNALGYAVNSLQSDAEAQSAFNLLSGEIHASIRGALVEDSRFVRNAAVDRLRSSLGGVGATSSGGVACDTGKVEGGQQPVAGCAFWMSGYGAWGQTNGDGNAALMTHDIGGFLIGADAPVFDSWRVGVFGGYSRSTFAVSGRLSSGWSDNFSLGAYGGSRWGSLGLRLGTAYTWSGVSTQRGVQFSGFSDSLAGSYQAGTFQVFGDAGYRLDAGAVSFEPFVGLAFVDVTSGGFSERGSLAALTAQGGDTAMGLSTLGVRTAASFAVAGVDLTAALTAGWRHAWGAVTPYSTVSFGGSSAFNVAGVSVAQNAALVEGGLSTDLASNVSAGLLYTGQFGSGTISQGLRGNVSIKF